MYNSIYFRRTGRVFFDAMQLIDGEGVSFSTLATVDANLRSLGYALSDDLARYAANKVDQHDFTIVMTEVTKAARDIKGVRNYRPMYPNFPMQVMDAPAAELYWNAIMHYAGDAIGWRIVPHYVKEARSELKGQHEVKFIELGSFDDFMELMANLASSKSAFSEQDKFDLGSLKREVFWAVLRRVDEFANRENKAWLVNECLVRDIPLDMFTFDTATDVLRLAVGMSNGDLSLSESTKFRSFKRSERRMFVQMLNKIRFPEEDMMRHQSAWKALLKSIHIKEYDLSEELDNAVRIVRDERKFQSFNSQVEAAIAAGGEDNEDVLTLLSTRPGEFVRRLRKLADTFYIGAVDEKLAEVGHQASATVLLQAINAFNAYNQSKAIRAVFPKGQVSKIKVIDNEQLPIWTARQLCMRLEECLETKFSELPPLGKVYLDPTLDNIAVPFALRNASKGRVLGRGSRLALDDETKVVRFFIWWKDGAERTDIDLSAALYDKDYNWVEDIAFHNLRGSGAVHSGDITSAPNGASEFIDIDIAALKARGVRYVSMVVNSYTGQTFAELPECFAGFMTRTDLESGEIYDPRTVAQRVDLTSNSRGSTPFIFDLVSREAIWVDLSFKIASGFSTSRSLAGQTVSTLQAMNELRPPTLGDLFYVHMNARGTQVFDPALADVAFAMEPIPGVNTVTPYDVETILSQYL